MEFSDSQTDSKAKHSSIPEVEEYYTYTPRSNFGGAAATGYRQLKQLSFQKILLHTVLGLVDEIKV